MKDLFMNPARSFWQHARGESSHAALPIALLLCCACGQMAVDDRDDSVAAHASAQATSAMAPRASQASGRESSAARALSKHESLPDEEFLNGADAFNRVRETLAQNYYAEGVGEDDLYRAATAGMLEKLEPSLAKYNQLLTPREVAEMKNDLKGEVVGVGVQISFDGPSGYADVLGALPGSPAERAGLRAGDKIVTVNGKLYKGMQLTDVIADIRGKVGDSVTLSVLRADQLMPFALVREKVEYDQAEFGMLPDAIGYVRVPSFNDKTPGAVRAALVELERSGARALVLDLRASPGGMFERALETAELFVEKGTRLVVLKSRGTNEPRVAAGNPILGRVPLVVLVNGETSSSSEYLAALLREHRKARVVGTRTRGKWSVQALEDLPNGYAFKYTMSMLETPAGKNYEGVGLAPDIEVALDETSYKRAARAKLDERLPLDTQLRTARELVLR